MQICLLAWNLTQVLDQSILISFFEGAKAGVIGSNVLG